jgi:pimeloyl-ACP methyl ester carboxylesterase
MRRVLLSLVLTAFLSGLLAQSEGLFHTLRVHVDHWDPLAGTTEIHYEFGAAFSPGKPTIFIIADAQQFYVRKGAVARLQATLLDSTFNVVGIIGRNYNDELRDLVTDPSGEVDWVKAHKIFSWPQYVNDIEEVRKKVVGPEGTIFLYGQSGGGLLIHQYLSLYGRHVDKAFTGASVNYSLDARLGIQHDKFWEEVVRGEHGFEGKMKTLLESPSIDRADLAMLFQRQHFFVNPDSLCHERNRLLEVLLEGDSVSIESYMEVYQINAIREMNATSFGIPIRVRVFEFVFPLLEDFRIREGALFPNTENMYFSTLPLIEKYRANEIQPLEMSFEDLHDMSTRVFVLAGRWDHTADYRSQIALASSYPKHVLFLANDNHTFNTLKQDGKYQGLIISFFNSANLREMKELLKGDFLKYRWVE